jgi:2-isopropylmalate synthase
VIPNLQLKLDYSCITDDQLCSLTSIARYISEVANMHMPVGQPYVGNAAFAHKGGIHVSAILRHPKTYEHITPELVGNKQRVLVSELAGQSNLIVKAQELKLDFDKDNPKVKSVIEQVKELEHQGYQFEGADASLELLLREAIEGLEEVFTLESFKIIVEKSAGRAVVSEAIVKVKVHGETMLTAAEGNGPVNALDTALRKALISHYPDIQNVHLTDYKVRVFDEKDATAAKVRVLVETADADSNWNTVGVSENIIEASWNALADSLRYALLGKTRVEHKEQTIEQQGLVNH